MSQPGVQINSQSSEALDPFKLIAAYERGVEELRESVAGMTDEQVRARPIPGKWSTLQVICHLADFELVNADRFQRVIAQERPTLFNAEPDDFAAALGYEYRKLEDELTLIAAVRRHIAVLLRGLKPDAWSRTWVHSMDGELTLLQLLHRTTRHIGHHLPFIAEKRAALGVPRNLQTASSS